MIIDIHTHIARFDDKKSLKPRGFCRLKKKILLAGLGIHKHASFEDRMIQIIQSSCIDKVVVLAFDAVYDSHGNTLETEYAIDNAYVARLAKKSKKILFGASVHPYRKDAQDALLEVINDGACLIKWVPSVQHIDPSSRQCVDFYNILSDYDIPLLSHTGMSHTLYSFDQSYNDPLRLETALKCGVKVIAAHCGAKMTLLEPDHFNRWCRLVEQYDHLYGDISAFALPFVRPYYLNKILRSPFLSSRILYGSDFPAKCWPLSFVGKIGWKDINELRQIGNPLDKAMRTMKQFGFDDSVFSKAEKILKIRS